MCTNQHYVFNKYLHRYIYVKCGHCEACRQEKADMNANKIRRQHRVGYVSLFVHLTYSNDCVPYIRKSEIKFLQKNNHKNYYINIYRDSVNRRVKDGINSSVKSRKLFSTHVIDKKYISRCNDITDIIGLKSMTNNPDKDKVSVIYYKDFQDFFKRLKEYVKYHYPMSLGQEDIKFFCTSEYGEDNSRAHFHLLFQVKETYVEIWKYAIAANWLFDDYNLTYNNIEIAIQAETYVSSYVNCDTFVCPFLRRNFPIVRRHSLFYGRENKAFTLPSILAKIESRDMRYDCLCRVDHESYAIRSVPIPKYVTDYWFPTFKGFSQLSSQEIFELLSIPQTIYKYADKLGLNSNKFDRNKKHFPYIVNEIDRMLKHIDTCVSRYYEDSDYIYDDSTLLRVAYATDYVRFLQSKNSTKWKRHYENVEKNSLESYINLDDRNIRHPILIDKALFNLMNYRVGAPLCIFNPNTFSHVVFKTNSMITKYNKYTKKHKTYAAIKSFG